MYFEWGFVSAIVSPEPLALKSLCVAVSPPNLSKQIHSTEAQKQIKNTNSGRNPLDLSGLDYILASATLQNIYFYSVQEQWILSPITFIESTFERDFFFSHRYIEREQLTFSVNVNIVFRQTWIMRAYPLIAFVSDN